MGYMWFDESLRDNGNFIIGTIVYSDEDLSPLVKNTWVGMGLPGEFEYKSSAPKAGNQVGSEARMYLNNLIRCCRIAFLVCPRSDRAALGLHAVALVNQLLRTQRIPNGPHFLYFDEGIVVPQDDIYELERLGISILLHQKSQVSAGIQLADLAAHSLGGMLLEEMGVISKTVLIGKDSGYDPDTIIEIGFELWASLRRSLMQSHLPIRALIGDDVNAFPVFQVEGYGLYVAPSCDEDLRKHVTARFSENYFGCLH